MKPDRTYPFGQQYPKLTLRLGEAGEEVWIAAVSPLTECKIAQTTAAAGEREIQLFCRDSIRKLVLPRDFLLADEIAPEICCIEEFGVNTPACFAAPLKQTHKRGCALYPAQHYRADEQGIVRAVFGEPGKVLFYHPGGTLVSAEMQLGENELELLR